eukprot:525250_1
MSETVSDISLLKQEATDILISMGYSECQSKQIATRMPEIVAQRRHNSPLIWIRTIYNLDDEYHPFRISGYSNKLMSGYIRNMNVGLNIPNGIKRIIILYFHLIFVRIKDSIYSDSNGYLMTFNKNLEVRQVQIMFEEKENYKYKNGWPLSRKKTRRPLYTRLYLRFADISCIFPIRNERLNISINDIETCNVNPLRWIQNPCDYEAIRLNDMDSLIDDKNIDRILELVIEKYDQINNIWPFQIKHRETDEIKPELLQIGDYIDVKDYHDKWYESIIKYIEKDIHNDDIILYIHFIGWDIKFDDKISVKKQRDCIAWRNTHSTGPHRPKKYKNYV